MGLGLLTFLVVVILLIIWLLVSILIGKSDIQDALQEAVCDILCCK